MKTQRTQSVTGTGATGQPCLTHQCLPTGCGRGCPGQPGLCARVGGHPHPHPTSGRCSECGTCTFVRVASLLFRCDPSSGSSRSLPGLDAGSFAIPGARTSNPAAQVAGSVTSLSEQGRRRAGANPPPEPGPFHGSATPVGIYQSPFTEFYIGIASNNSAFKAVSILELLSKSSFHLDFWGGDVLLPP